MQAAARELGVPVRLETMATMDDDATVSLPALAT